jgi:hypothetical protein
MPVASATSDTFPWGHFVDDGPDLSYHSDPNYVEPTTLNPMDVTSIDDVTRKGTFVEAQVFGGVNPSDIKEIVITADSSKVPWGDDSKMYELAAKLGIPVRNDFQVKYVPNDPNDPQEGFRREAV